MIAVGAADLRFYQGNFTGIDFPIDTPTRIRIDLWDAADRIPAGHRVGVVVSYGESFPLGIGTAGQPYYGTITVHGDSHVVLPFVEGTLGGSAPTLGYPPRPFVPS